MDKYNHDDAKKLVGEMSKEDIEQYVKTGHECASKAVLHAIGAALDARNCKHLAKRVRAVAAKGSHALQVDFEYNGTTYALCTALVNVPAGYKTEISVPPKFDRLGDVMTNYNMLRLFAVTYWEHFRSNNSKLYREISDIFGETMLTEVAGNPTALLFQAASFPTTPECACRIGIFCYYKDDANRVLRAKSGNTAAGEPAGASVVAQDDTIIGQLIDEPAETVINEADVTLVAKCAEEPVVARDETIVDELADKIADISLVRHASEHDVQ